MTHGFKERYRLGLYSLLRQLYAVLKEDVAPRHYGERARVVNISMKDDPVFKSRFLNGLANLWHKWAIADDVQKQIRMLLRSASKGCNAKKWSLLLR
ncbi:hypothetical protein GCM10022276_10430 [Sphingomonas limnosediminicola]|uniref:Uncharacterized protein n=1 Tax=Sphingomonas limnosediminicola TaxID=940133 RepID=A0ABP7L1E1_9SPHN